MKLYELHWGGEEVCLVVAPTPSKAKSIAMRESHKARKADYVSLSARQTEPWDGLDLSRPYFVFDIETYRDVMEQELWDWYAMQ